jgi:capsular polysaccharide biosynthesis protein
MRNVLIGFLLGVGTTLIISYIRAYIKNAKYELKV